MKKSFFIICVLLNIAEITFSQVKLTKATSQKSHDGMGGVFMNYVIEFKNKSKDTIVIDSVKTIADASVLQFSAMKTEKGIYQVSFGYALSGPARCKTCPDTTPKQSNLTKGAIVYYANGKEKHFFNVKKFKQLPEVMLP